MTGIWSTEQVASIDKSDELEIAVRRADGSLGRWTPIWVVRVQNQVFVRTWQRRDTGWFGLAVRFGQARIRVPGLEADVTVTDVGLEATPDTAAAGPGTTNAVSPNGGPGSASLNGGSSIASADPPATATDAAAGTNPSNAPADVSGSDAPAGFAPADMSATGLRAAVDDAYRAKYARYGSGSVGQMVTDAAASTTLRLSPGR